jgi:hypothetical protein
MKLLEKAFPKACLPTSFDESMKYIRGMGLIYEKTLV